MKPHFDEIEKAINPTETRNPNDSEHVAVLPSVKILDSCVESNASWINGIVQLEIFGEAGYLRGFY